MEGKSAFLCRMGFHWWDACQCAWCGHNRGDRHRWRACKCDRCGERQSHSSSTHSWSQCRCTACGLQRNSDHVYAAKLPACDDLCSVCARPYGKNAHNYWSASQLDRFAFCSKCGYNIEGGRRLAFEPAGRGRLGPSILIPPEVVTRYESKHGGGPVVHRLAAALIGASEEATARMLAIYTRSDYRDYHTEGALFSVPDESVWDSRRNCYMAKDENTRCRVWLPLPGFQDWLFLPWRRGSVGEVICSDSCWDKYISAKTLSQGHSKPCCFCKKTVTCGTPDGLYVLFSGHGEMVCAQCRKKATEINAGHTQCSCCRSSYPYSRTLEYPAI